MSISTWGWGSESIVVCGWGTIASNGVSDNDMVVLPIFVDTNIFRCVSDRSYDVILERFPSDFCDD